MVFFFMLSSSSSLAPLIASINVNVLIRNINTKAPITVSLNATTTLRNAATKRFYATSKITSDDSKSLKANINAVASLTEKSSSVVDFPPVGALHALLLLRSPTKVLNSGRWSFQERQSTIDKMSSMNFNPNNRISMNDCAILSEHVGTRSPLQCYSYVRYHFRD